jgi:multidrug efflux pump
MRNQPMLIDVDTDQEENGVETFVSVDRDTASRLGVNSRDVNNALYNSFGQRQVSTIYDELNQYRVIMEVGAGLCHQPRVAARCVRAGPWRRRHHAQTGLAAGTSVASAPATTAAVGTTSTTSTNSAASSAGVTASTTGTPPSRHQPAPAVNPGLRDASTGQALSTAATPMVPLSAFASVSQRATPPPSATRMRSWQPPISFNLPEGVPEPGAGAVRQAEADIGMPISVRGSFQGSARGYSGKPDEAAAAADRRGDGRDLHRAGHAVREPGASNDGAVHAAVGRRRRGAGADAVRMEFSIIALIGVFLLIGIVKKNAILIIDFALEAERVAACRPRGGARGLPAALPPILMTTMAAALGALPLAIGFGEGAELRRPLGIAIIGGLIASQVLTLIDHARWSMSCSTSCADAARANGRWRTPPPNRNTI